MKNGIPGLLNLSEARDFLLGSAIVETREKFKEWLRR
jgi:hypothetical protein